MNRNTRGTVEALFIMKFEIFFDLFLRYNTQLWKKDWIEKREMQKSVS